jgi:hypothetical protein
LIGEKKMTASLSKVSMNNIVIEHYGVKVSIAQHKTSNPFWTDARTFVQEVMVLDGPLRDTIYEFDGTLTGLSSVLVAIEEDLNKKENGE